MSERVATGVDVKRKTPTRRTLVKLCVGLVLGIALSEVALRFLPRSLLPDAFWILDRKPTAPFPLAIGDPYLGYVTRPDLDRLFPSEGRRIPTRTTNYGLGNIGFRDIGTQAPFAVIAVGDSFTFCDEVGVEDCWVRRLADSTRLSIATLGVKGYSTLAEARMLKRYGRQLAPRLVLVGVFLNDFVDNVQFDAWLRSGAENFPVWQARETGGVGRWLADHWMTYRLVAAALQHAGDASYEYKHDNVDLVFQIDRWWLQLVRNAEHEPGWRLMQEGLLDMRATTVEMGADLVVLLFPSKEQVYWDNLRPRTSYQNLNIDHPYDVILQFCEDNGVHVCDTTGRLREAARGGRQLYRRMSWHWNEEGNAVAAEAIGDCLADFGVLEGLSSASNATSPLRR